MPKTITFALVNRAAVERITFDPVGAGWTASITYLLKTDGGLTVTRQVHTKALGAGAVTQIDAWLTNQLATLNTDEGLV
jgi:hypothetical protein